MRAIRRLLITLAILAGLFVAGNVAGERFAEARVAVAAQRAFGLSTRPDVEIDGFPILLKIIDGSLPSLTMTATDVEVKDLRVRSLTVELRSIEVDGGLLGEGPLAIVVGEGTATAEVGQPAVNALLRERGEDATITLRPGGRARVRATRSFLGRSREFVADGRLVLRGTTLTFEADHVTIDGEPPPPGTSAEAERRSSVAVDLPKLPGAFTIDGLSTGRGTLSLTASAADKRIVLRGDGG